MTSAMMTYSGATIPSFFGGKAASARQGVSLRDWVSAFRSAVAMANAVPSTGRVSASHVARVRAMADAI